jgi:hypothetical protein
VNSSNTTTIRRQTLIASGATTVSYIGTVGQQLVYARVLGVSAETDALAAALSWSVTVTGVIGTTFASVAIPAYVAARATNPSHARSVFRTASLVALAATVIVAVVTALGSHAIADVLLPGADISTTAALQQMLDASSLVILAWMASILSTSLANAEARYAAGAATGLLPSAVVIVLLLGWGDPRAVLAGYGIGFAVQAAYLWATRLDRVRRTGPLLDLTEASSLARHVLPIGIAFLCINASNVVLRAEASFGSPGDVALVDYATRLTTAIETVVLSGALAVVLTTWSGAGERALSLGRALRFSIAVSAGVALGLIVLAPLAAAVLLGQGETATELTPVVRIAAVAMAARMVHMVAVRRVLADRASWRMAAIGASVLIAIGIGCVLGRPWGLGGVMTGYSAGWLVAGAVTVWLAARPGPWRGLLPKATSTD